MPDIFNLLARWWKQITAMVLLALITVGIIVFLQPEQYLAVTTAVPASAYSADRSKVFNENIEGLYSNLGTPDDLDMIVGTAQLDTVYEYVIDVFNLYDHYKLKLTGEPARRKAAMILQKNSRVFKSDYGELKVKVWDTDKNLAAQLSDAIMDKLQSIHQNLQNAGNAKSLEGLQLGKQKIQGELDSIDHNLYVIKADQTKEGFNQLDARQKTLSIQLVEYEKLIGEYQLMVNSKPPVLIIVEKGKGSRLPDRPNRIQVLVIAALLSFIFALFVALILERRKIVFRERLHS